jgi:hypothetical protein
MEEKMSEIHQAIVLNDIVKFRQLINSVNSSALDKEICYKNEPYSILGLAALLGRKKHMEILIEKGLDIHLNQDEAFKIAARKGDKEILEYIISVTKDEDTRLSMLDAIHNLSISKTTEEYLEDAEQAQD